MTDETQSDFPAAWRPDQDDPKTVKGIVQSVVMGPDFGWGSYPIVTILDDSGTERAIHAQGKILREELARRRPGAGDELEVTYLGTRAPKSGTGKPYRVYKVVGGKERAFNWDAQLPAEERQVSQEAVDLDLPFDPVEPSRVPAASAAAQFGDKPPF
jgi:hypothetical protein